MLVTKLDNGLEIVLKENHFSKLTSIQCWVKTGSMHETEHERGMAHVLEHMIFKGTPTVKPGEMASAIEACGGDINAYTTFDRTVYFANLVSKHTKLGIDLLCDSILNATFDEEEFSKEKEVILEEIKRGVDSPSSKLGYKLFSECYPGCEIGRPVIGNSEAVSSFKRKDLVNFHSKWYVPNNMTFVVAGDFDTKEVYSQLESIFGKLEEKETAVPGKVKQEFHEPSPAVHLLKEDHSNLRLEIALPCPSLEEFDAPMIDLAAFALGSGDSSRLIKTLKYEKGLVAGISSSAFTPSFPGLFTVTAIIPEENFLKAVEEIGEQLKLLVTSSPVTEEEINRARASLRMDRIYRDEQVEGLAKTLGFGMQTAHKVHFDSIYSHQIDIADPQVVEASVKRWLDLAKAKIVAMVPKGSDISEAQIEKAYLKGIDGYRNFSSLSSLLEVNHEDSEVPDIKTYTLSNGSKFIYRQNFQTKQFVLATSTHGGLRLENESNVGIHNLVSSLIGEESKQYGYDEILDKVESLGIGMGGFSGKDSIGMSLHCHRDHIDEILPMFTDCFLNPIFPENQYRSTMMEIAEVIISHKDSPSSIAMRRFSEVLFHEKHPYRNPVYGSLEVLENFDLKTLQDFYQSLVARGPWVISAVGSEDPEVVYKKIDQHLGKFPISGEGKGVPSLDDDLVNDDWHGITEHCELDREQTHIVMGYRGLDWRSPLRPALDVLVNILGGHGGRLFVNLREKESLAYSVSPVVSYGAFKGGIGGYIACSPEKKERAVTMMREEFEKIAKEPPTNEELERSINYIVGQHEVDMQKPDSQALTMGLMDLYGNGFDDFMSYPKEVSKVTAEDVMGVAKKLFLGKEPICISCGQK